MHADIEQLLSIRGIDEMPRAMSEHVACCPACKAQWQQIQTRREELRGLPIQQPPADSWQHILEAYNATDNGKRKRRTSNIRLTWWFTPALAAGIAALIIALPSRLFSPEIAVPGVSHQAPVSGATKTTPAGIAELMAESRRLENSLRSFDDSSVEIRASTAGTVAVLEDQLAHVDQQLMLSPADVHRGKSAKNLWQTRVELLHSLLDVRYAQEVSQAL